MFVKHPKDRSILLLAWVGEEDKFHAIVAADGKLSTREGKGYVDEDKYWYACFLGGWQQIRPEMSLSERSKQLKRHQLRRLPKIGKSARGGR